MAARRQRILEDVQELQTACRNGTFPQVEKADLEDDTLLIQILGGQFTACLADPYPSGETEVYGPDEFEFRSTGQILDILLALLAEVAEVPPLPEDPPLADELVAQLPEEELEDDAARWIVTEMAPEGALQQDLQAFKSCLGQRSVTLTQLGSDFWRCRLHVDVSHHNLSSTVCSAWGIDLKRPICVELRLPTSGYSFESLNRCIQRVTQEGFQCFALEAQLLHMLEDFCQLCRDSSWKSWKEEKLDFSDTEVQHDSEALRYECKKKRLILAAMESKDSGFLVCLARYLQLRVPTVHEFCAICDKPFQQPPMMMRSVCAEELCTYQFSEFGSKITTAESVNHPSEILDLLVCMLSAAAVSHRRQLILEPYPLVQVATGDHQGHVLHPQRKDFEKLEEIVKELQSTRSNFGKTMGAAWALCTAQMSAAAAGLLKWTVSSNRSYLAPIEDSQRIEALRTPFQYLLLSAPPEKEAQFQELKKKYGTSFAFHGSSAENWHSILRNGLKNASHTNLMTSGAAHGPGIYLATDSATSIAYTRYGKRKAPAAPLLLQPPATRPMVWPPGSLAQAAPAAKAPGTRPPALRTAAAMLPSFLRARLPVPHASVATPAPTEGTPPGTAARSRSLDYSDFTSDFVLRALGPVDLSHSWWGAPDAAAAATAATPSASSAPAATPPAPETAAVTPKETSITPSPPELKRHRTGNRFVTTAGGPSDLVMMAICEVIQHPEKLKKATKGIWVAATEELVCTRFFLVFPGLPEGNVKIRDLEKELHALAEKVRVF